MSPTIPRDTMPAGVRLVCAVEALQRLSYFGGRGLLILFLSTGLAQSGFGWTTADTLRFYGQFVGLYLATPLLGGLLADRWLGHVRASAIGIALMAAGYTLLLAGISYPYIAAGWLGTSLHDLAALAGVPIGALFPAVDDMRALALAAGPAGEAAVAAYRTTGLLFYAGIAGIIIGNGFFQSSSMTVLAKHYPAGDPRRDGGFTWHYVAQCAGAVFGVLLVGSLGELVAWPAGFAAAAFAVIVATVVFLAFRNRCIALVSTEATADLAAGEPEADGWIPRLVVLGVLMTFALVYTVGYEQFMGLIALYIREGVDRDILGFTVPASWFPQFVSVFGLIIGGPYVAAMIRLARAGAEPSVPEKFALGFMLTGLAFVIVWWGVKTAGADGSSMVWLVLAYGLLTFGEIALWPVGYSVVSKLAPSRHVALALGAWLLIGASAGSWLAGEVGAVIADREMTSGLLWMAGLMAMAGAILLVVQRPLIRLAAEASFSGRIDPASFHPNRQARNAA